ncbi:DUF4194 domain-containing protein [Glutamicibacter endophyticus]|uniref:DUF4194 domain-containing protein n=1 Tax=Glutamicibacter endophyticus TaxID=1522174 RepID=UPI003AF12431
MTDLFYDENRVSETETPDPEEGLSLGLFEGDTGTLFPEQRRCLHALLKHRYISAEQYPEQWETLLKDETGIIKSRLNDLYLDLEIEWEQRIAFKRRAISETGDSLPSLLREASHTKEETIVMMTLRQRYFAQRQEGDEAVFVDREGMLEEIRERWPEHLTNRAAALKKAGTSIDGLIRAGVLLRTTDENRFRISPIIEVLLPVEKLHELLAWLMNQNGTAPQERDEPEDELDLEGLNTVQQEDEG